MNSGVSDGCVDNSGVVKSRISGSVVQGDNAEVHADGETTEEPPIRQIIDVLQQVMCSHDAEKLAISVLEIYEDGHREERRST